MKKVNLCCGGQILEDWENYDYDVRRSPKIKFIDLLSKFTIEDNSVDMMYFCHAIEHFDEVQGFDILRKIKLSLKPGGVVRIVCPSLDTYVRRFLDWNGEFNAVHRTQFSSGTSFLNYAFFGEHAAGMKFLDGKNSKNLGHKFIYSEQDMIEKLTSLGFTKIKICKYNDSEYSEFQNLDACRPDYLDLIIEASYE